MPALLYRSGHLPYGTQPGPLYNQLDPFETLTASVGSGTHFPLTMSMAELAACLFRIKSWKLTGNVSIDYSLEDYGSWSGSSPIDVVFEREITEERLFLLPNGKAGQIFKSQPQECLFSGTYEYLDQNQDPQSVTANFVLQLNLDRPDLGEESGNSAVGRSGENYNVAAQISANLSATWAIPNPPNADTIDNRNFGNHYSSGPNAENPISGTAAAALTVSGPFATDKTIDLMWDGEGGATYTLTDLLLEPHEWFTYAVRGQGPIYDSQTGAFL